MIFCWITRRVRASPRALSSDLFDSSVADRLIKQSKSLALLREKAHQNNVCARTWFCACALWFLSRNGSRAFFLPAMRVIFLSPRCQYSLSLTLMRFAVRHCYLHNGIVYVTFRMTKPPAAEFHMNFRWTRMSGEICEWKLSTRRHSCQSSAGHTREGRGDLKCRFAIICAFGEFSVLCGLKIM